jgi:hypothetical protein
MRTLILLFLFLTSFVQVVLSQNIFTFRLLTNDKTFTIWKDGQQFKTFKQSEFGETFGIVQ